jgi:hypothetical protein
VLKSELHTYLLLNIFQDVPHSGLTEAQLEELFKRTSSFTVKSAVLQIDDPDELDELELLRMEYGDSEFEFEEE